jgi:hypothetical protein
MKKKKLNETNNIKLILSNKKLLIRKIVKKGKKKLIITHFLEPKPESHDLGGLSRFTAKVENQVGEEGDLWCGTCSIPLVRLNQWN